MKFNSSYLQSCFDTNKSVLDNINEIKNSISSDIKQLENYLKSINIGESVTYVATDPTQSRNYCEPISIEEKLSWDKIQNRLIYEKSEYEGEIHYYENSFDIDLSSRKIIIEKPLIETPFEIRKHVYESGYLGDFLLYVASKFSINKKLNEWKIHDDVPF
ncbi:MAG TPA: hypothetical protein VJK30_07030 [Coxiellaceae bacterium]|nr:MAG: hypothetical protein A3E81_07800 [Gammaproteobacteria bacterium RIFCSPHIGHO2_12_FULL_36_30]HLB57062.1 hypothetical protein [Coxiellaceae bacterium]